MQHADQNWFVIVFEGILVSLIMWKIFGSIRGNLPFIRRIPGLNAIDEAIGRATEMGRPAIMIPGLSGLDIVGLQALNIFQYVTRTAARFGSPIRLLLADPILFTVAQEVVQDAYRIEGRLDVYDPESVRYVASGQFAFAAGASGVIQREKAAAVFLMGVFFAESLILAETANSVGAIQVAGTTMTTQTPFFVAACDYVIIGDEFYAASAYLSREPVALGSLVGQDYAKLALVAIIVIGCVVFTITGPQLKGSEPLMYKLFNIGGWDALMQSIRHLFHKG